MRKTKIIVIEDEVIVAKDIQKSLIQLGYDVPAVANSAQVAFEKIDEYEPDLVFCDIKLKGSIDGIDIASRLREEYLIPVIFLTSYVDKETLDRAKVTEPYGYIVKPFNQTDLETTVAMALYKFEKDMEVRDNEKRFANVISNIDEAICIVNLEDKVTFLNTRAEQLFKLSFANSLGHNLAQLLTISHNNYMHGVVKMPVTLNNATISNVHNLQPVSCNIVISPIHDEINQLIGNAIIIRPNAFANESEVLAPPLSKESEEAMVFQDSFFVKKGSVLVKVFLTNIHWIQAMDNYVVIQTSADQFVVHSTMRNIEAKLPAENFVRVHRSYIVQTDKITSMEDNSIVINDKIIPVGKSYRDLFLKRFNFL
ncbi:MAG: response regulator [Bacteroidia bacterium]|nr:response regulator [Bacteroidia bacterium]